MKTIRNFVTIAAIVVAGNVGTISAQEIEDYENRVIVNEEIGKPNPFGKENSLLVENFTTLETGSEESPSRINNSDLLPGWEVKNIYSAGGKIWIPSEYSKITTPAFPKLKAGETVWFRFKAKSERLSGKLSIKIEGTGKDKEFIKGDIILSTPVTNKWEEYYSFFYDGAVDSKISLYLGGSSSIYIDDIEIFTVDQYVSTPKTLPHSNYDGKSFIANWTKSDGAIGYKINVFTVDSKFIENYNVTSKIKDYLVKDKLTGDNFFVVKGIDPNESYYYTVTACNDTTCSIPSRRVGVADVASPKIEETNIKNGRIDFKWSSVEGAKAYEYSVLRKKVFEKDEEVVVSEENMEDLRCSLKVSREEFGDIRVYFATEEMFSGARMYYFNRQHGKNYFDIDYNGWKASYCSVYKEGYLGLNNLEYVEKSTGEIAKVISPELDLSKNDGRFRLSVKLQSASALCNGDKTDFRTQARFILKNYNESACRYETSEIIYAKNVEDYWKTFEVNFSNGTSKSIVEIEVIDSIGINLYVDDIKIVQSYKAGDTTYFPVYGTLTRENDGSMSVYDTVSNTAEYIQRVSSIKIVKPEEYYLISKDLVTSGSCEASAGTVTNSIDNLQQPEFSVEVKNNTVYITNTGTYKVSVFTLDGKRVYSGVNKDSHCINLPSNTYIIHVGNKSMKLVF